MMKIFVHFDHVPIVSWDIGTEMSAEDSKLKFNTKVLDSATDLGKICQDLNMSSWYILLEVIKLKSSRK